MDLLTFLKKNQNARKVFGKRELVIIEKQLLGIALTQSEKNRLSRDIRKKFEFIEQCWSFKEEFKLKKGSVITKLIAEAKEEILQDQLRSQIKKIILYGSSAENKRTFKSDIDLAVVFKKIDLSEATKFRIRIAGKISNLIDIQVYNILPKKIKDEIDAKGQILWGE